MSAFTVIRQDSQLREARVVALLRGEENRAGNPGCHVRKALHVAEQRLLVLPSLEEPVVSRQRKNSQLTR